MEIIDSIFYFIVICLVVFANHVITFNNNIWYIVLANILFKTASYFTIGYSIFVLLCYFEVIPYIVIANQCK